MHWVKIFFATPTFDRITKDEKANFAAKLSAIGGTLGLLTGFSFISCIEIIFHIAKIWMGFVGMVKKTRNLKKIDINQKVIMVESIEKEEEGGIIWKYFKT